MSAPHFTICILLGFIAISIWCAVRIGLRRPTPADPFFHPFGDMPGFTAEQLRVMSASAMQNAACDPLLRRFTTQPDQNSAGLALRSADVDGGRPLLRSWLASVGDFFRGRNAAA